MSATDLINFTSGDGNITETGNRLNANDLSVSYLNRDEGCETKKGGKKYGELFRDDLLKAYTNLTASPVLLALYLFVLIVSLAEAWEIKNGPIEQWNDILTNSTPAWIIGKWIRSFLLWVFKIYVNNKIISITISNFALPFLYKPSNKNLYFSILIAVLSIFIINRNVLEIIFMSQLWFLYTQSRDGRFRFIYMMIGIVMFILPSTGLLEYAAPTPIPVTPPTTPPPPHTVYDTAKNTRTTKI